ncbi:DUF4238 domain-containing protein [Acetobacter orientalis]|uniref:DUF4238 domain-containing protein n=1 Tax=Acetobacter orientalis TaxID=146474 RepID=UPI00209EE76E|nr:DUF4238 domain-containing protein [Acetobacter orientalis]MCP1215090.1 DUF4238 domain-containing protein [Acetobacter orientalis]MCP1218673.1 DUF4238 domain-containing protein [Acetobacter orientalis]
MKLKPIVKRQHYVWKAYFLPWSRNKIIYSYIDRGILELNVDNISVKNYMYRFGVPNEKEISIIDALFVRDGCLFKLNYDFNKVVIDNYKKILDMKKSGIQDDFVEYCFKNLIESCYESLEHDFHLIYQKMINKDLSFYAEDNARNIFYHWLSSQVFRTLGVKKRTIELFVKKQDLNFSNSWSIIALLISFELSTSLLNQNVLPSIYLIENKTNVPFLTSDQPVINLDGRYDDNAPDELSWYYPLGPSLALLVVENDKYKDLYLNNLEIPQVDFLNEKIITFSNEQIYGDSINILERYVENIEYLKRWKTSI